VQHYRVDREHSNAFEVWKRQGSPAEPTAAQYAELERAMRLAEYSGEANVQFADGTVEIEFALPRSGVSLVQIGR
jgi:xylan 1,4-beta-xylosidase